MQKCHLQCLGRNKRSGIRSRELGTREKEKAVAFARDSLRARQALFACLLTYLLTYLGRKECIYDIGGKARRKETTRKNET
jgi:hypothetical protein